MIQTGVFKIAAVFHLFYSKRGYISYQYWDEQEYCSAPEDAEKTLKKALDLFFGDKWYMFDLRIDCTEENSFCIRRSADDKMNGTIEVIRQTCRGYQMNREPAAHVTRRVAQKWIMDAIKDSYTGSTDGQQVIGA